VDQVISAKAVDDVRATVLKYDANTTIYDDITTPMRVPGDAGVNLFAADFTGNALYFGAREIFNYVNIHLVVAGTISSDDLDWQYWNGSAWVTLPVTLDGTDPGTGPLQRNGTVSFTPPNDWEATEIDIGGGITYLRMWIRLKKMTGGATWTIIPTGDWCSLPPAFGYVDLYVHDGSGDASATLRTAVESAVELYRGCGIIVTVKPPEKIIPTITVRILVASNYDVSDMAIKVRQTIIDWLNAKVLAEDLYIADLYQLVMNYNDQAILNCIIEECSKRVIDVPTNTWPPGLPEVRDLVVWSAAVVRPDTLIVPTTSMLHPAKAIVVNAVGVD